MEVLCNLVGIYGKLGCEGKLLSLDIMGDTAAAKFEIIYPFATYMGYMSLTGYDGHLFIVNKIYSWVANPEAADLFAMV